MDFTGDMGLWQRRVAECPGGVAQRMAVLQALSPSVGQSTVDVGCGGGHLVRELASAVGDEGLAVGLDISEDQVATAREYCIGLDAAEFYVGSAIAMDFDNGGFDRLASIRTLEYIEDVPAALAELKRVLKPGGVAAMVSVLWDQFRFHGADQALNERILDAFRAHCPHQMLPMALPGMLAKCGFVGGQQETVTLFERTLNQNSYAFWVSKIVAAFAVGEGISDEDAKLWLLQLQAADLKGEFGFVSVPVLTVTHAVD